MHFNATSSSQNGHFCTDCRGFCKSLLVELGWTWCGSIGLEICSLSLGLCLCLSLNDCGFHLDHCPIQKLYATCLPVVSRLSISQPVSELESVSCLAMPRSLLTLQLVLVSGGSMEVNCNLHNSILHWVYLRFLSFPSLDAGSLLAAAYGAWRMDISGTDFAVSNGVSAVSFWLVQEVCSLHRKACVNLNGLTWIQMDIVRLRRPGEKIQGVASHSDRGPSQSLRRLLEQAASCSGWQRVAWYSSCHSSCHSS